MSDGSASDSRPDRESTGDVQAEGEAGLRKGESASAKDVPEAGESPEEMADRRGRLEAAKRRYRATLRNEAETGGGGFSEDYYRSQKPPHW